MADEVIEKINKCLIARQSFLLSGGAGSGKTHTLRLAIDSVFANNPAAKVACITYTNVAADEIKRRSSYKELHVSTIHDFLWSVIKNFQRPLKDALFTLIDAENTEEGTRINYSGETEIDRNSISKIEYRNYRKLEVGVISHDDLLKIAFYLFQNYPLLSKILSDKFDFIFIDEYQDTDKKVISLFLEYAYENATKKKLCLGFFGDRMQSIYANGVGNIQRYVDEGKVKEIPKEDNYRCSQKVIDLINKIRDDEIKQKPSLMDENGKVLNKDGKISFLYSAKDDFDLDVFKSCELLSDWEFNNPQQTKILFLTHKLIAKRLGFLELLEAYKYTDNLTGNEPDVLATHLLRIGEVINNFKNKNYIAVIRQISYKINSHQKKAELSRLLAAVSSGTDKTIEDIINDFDANNIIKLDDRLKEFFKEHTDLYSAVKILPASQLLAYYGYYNSLSPYSTQHGVKGAEFDNVLVILDNGRWNNYNFQYYFESTAGKESIIERTKRIFYVCCSRSKNNLAVFINNPSANFISKAKDWFGDENVHKI